MYMDLTLHHWTFLALLCGITPAYGAKFWRGKILMNQGWENFNEQNIDECQCVHFIFILIVMLTARTPLSWLVTHIYKYYSEKILKPVYTHAFARTLIDINVNQPHLFQWPQDMCKHGEGHVISHRITCIDWFYVPVGHMIEHPIYY